MNYHIDTALIWEAFRTDCECPLCQIYDIVNQRVVEQFTTEAVMEDSARTKVNRLGFCADHFRQLFEGQNKLGIALQTSTRLQTLRREMAGITNAREARKEAERLKKALSTCVLCELNDFNMKRYFQTVAQMYVKEPEFPPLLEGSKGFCLKHYAALLEYSGAAGLQAKNYVTALREVEERNLERLQKELNWFCDKFDYRNSDKPWGNSKDAVIRTIRKIQGN